MNFEVSVIMPVYNVENYIEESLKSVCEQRFENYEIVIVNDGSKDNSINIAENILKKYRITYQIVNQDNGGLPCARNTGLKYARGKYVCFIDSDDIIAPEHIRSLYTCCETNKLFAGFSLFQLTYESNRNGEIDNEGSEYIISRKELLNDFLIRKMRIHCCSLLINRSYLIKNNFVFNEKLRYGEDIDFMWRVFPTLSSIGCTGKATYKYLQRQNSLMTVQSMDRVLVLLYEFKNTVDNLINQYPDDYNIFKFLYGKASLAFYRTFAESSSLELFRCLLKRTDYKRNIRCLVFIKDIKIKILAMCLLISPKLFSIIVIKNRETVGVQ